MFGGIESWPIGPLMLIIHPEVILVDWEGPTLDLFSF